jgi:hypothetical protein
MREVRYWFQLVMVVLVGVVILLVQFIVLAGLTGGRWTLLAAGFFGVEGVAQIHHIVKTIVHGAYFPGAVTAVVYVPVAAMLLVAIGRQLRLQPIAAGRTNAVRA